MNVWLRDLNLNNITLFGQDWGGLIGLRLVVENQDKFDSVVLSNTGLPTGDVPPGEAFESWKNYSQTVENFHAGGIVKGGTVNDVYENIIKIVMDPHNLKEDQGLEIVAGEDEGIGRAAGDRKADGAKGGR